MQKIKIKDYGDPWINRLAVVDATVAAMEPAERLAVLNWLKSKFRSEWPSEQ